MTRGTGIYADLPAIEAEYRAGFALGVKYAQADRRDYVNGEAELRAEVQSESRPLRAFRLGIVRGYREEREPMSDRYWIADPSAEDVSADPRAATEWRVVDEDKGGTIAYTESREEAEGFISGLLARERFDRAQR